MNNEREEGIILLVLYVQGTAQDVQELQLDEASLTLCVNGRPCRLTEQEFQLLFVLAHHANRVLTRDELLRTVWGFVIPGPTRTVDVHIQRLRKKTGLTCIETVLGRGYRLCAQKNDEKYEKSR